MKGGTMRETIMCKITETVQVKTRLPLAAWALAGLVTLFSLASTLVQGPAFNHAETGSAPNVMRAAAVR
jgi:hypothetical protein